jgi:5-methylcytosine-specific restriction endonuclease McrA
MQNEYDKRAAHIKAEKQKAKTLRKSVWWENLCQSAVCYYCQQPIPSDEVTMDHIVPLSRGGFSKKGNLVPCCKSCNTTKRDKTAVELILEQIRAETSI